MKARDILILIGLVLLILALTAIEKYSEAQKEERRRAEFAQEQREWLARMTRQFEARWADLSDGLRTTLDSIAEAVIAGGVSPESLAVVIVDSVPAPAPETTPQSPPPTPRARPDTFARQVANEYQAALAALPGDLNAYESRVASEEVASLIRARHGLTEPHFDSLLKDAGKPEGQ